MTAKRKGYRAPIGAVTQAIIGIKVAPTDSMDALRAQLYRVLRKHGIKQGTKLPGGGLQCNNYEWTGAMAIFDEHVTQERRLHYHLGEVPKDLRC